MRRKNAAVDGGHPRPSSARAAMQADQVKPVRRRSRGAKRSAAGMGVEPISWSGQAKRAAPPGAKASAMEAEGARRHRRLDAQHDSAARHPRETHGSRPSWYRCTDRPKT